MKKISSLPLNNTDIAVFTFVNVFLGHPLGGSNKLNHSLSNVNYILCTALILSIIPNLIKF